MILILKFMKTYPLRFGGSYCIFLSYTHFAHLILLKVKKLSEPLKVHVVKNKYFHSGYYLLKIKIVR
jgi:hypothetical protein